MSCNKPLFPIEVYKLTVKLRINMHVRLRVFPCWPETQARGHFPGIQLPKDLSGVSL